MSLFLTIACNPTKKSTDTMPNETELTGTWELNYVANPPLAFNELYSIKKPAITFDVAGKTVSGNTGCNSFSGKLNVSGNKISFNEPMALTKMMCEGDGEQTFLEALNKVNTWAVTEGKTLNLIMGDIAVMRFTKK